MAILCAVGEGLRTDPASPAGCSARSSGVPLRMVSQAASRRNMTVVLNIREEPAALGRLLETAIARQRLRLRRIGSRGIENRRT